MMEELHKIIKIVDDTKPTTGEWICVGDKLPNYNQRVLVVYPWNGEADEITIACRLSTDANGECWSNLDDKRKYSVTAWMPLPIKPKK